MADYLALPREEVQSILKMKNPEAVALYLYLRAGGRQEDASRILGIPEESVQGALLMLDALGAVRIPRPAAVTDEELLKLMEKDDRFLRFSAEVQRLLGRVLSTNDLRLLAGLVANLQIEMDAVILLVNDCVAQAKEQGRNPPTMRTVEREAYRWADLGAVTMERASSYLQKQRAQRTALRSLAQRFEMGREFKAPERGRVLTWMELGFGEEEIYLAYERCLEATKALKWQYMDRIVRSWHEQNLHTKAEILQWDQRPQSAAQGGRQDPRGPLTSSNPGELERRMLERLREKE